ncbi:MAG: hypothetical protein GY926_12075 [bacterium]|nr:hypothetical protein [bacterium]
MATAASIIVKNGGHGDLNGLARALISESVMLGVRLDGFANLSLDRLFWTGVRLPIEVDAEAVETLDTTRLLVEQLVQRLDELVAHILHEPEVRQGRVNLLNDRLALTGEIVEEVPDAGSAVDQAVELWNSLSAVEKEALALLFLLHARSSAGSWNSPAFILLRYALDPGLASLERYPTD